MNLFIRNDTNIFDDKTEIKYVLYFMWDKIYNY